MDDRIDIVGKQGLTDRPRVADIRFDKCESLSGKVPDALLFDGTGIEGIEVVDGRDVVAVRKEAATEVCADEAGTPSDTDTHCGDRFILEENSTP